MTFQKRRTTAKPGGPKAKSKKSVSADSFFLLLSYKDSVSQTWKSLFPQDTEEEDDEEEDEDDDEQEKASSEADSSSDDDDEDDDDVSCVSLCQYTQR